MKKSVMIICGLLVVVGVLVLGYLKFVAPPDWRFGADEASSGTTDDGNPWFGADAPRLVIHEYLDYDCPHCPGAHKKLRRLMARKLDRVRLVRHDYARMKCRGNIGSMKTCELVLAAICASHQMPYWKWNDEIIAEPRSESKVAYKNYVPHMVKKTRIDKGRFDKCMEDPATTAQAQKIYKATKKAGVNQTPTYIVNGKKRDLDELAQLIGEL